MKKLLLAFLLIGVSQAAPPDCSATYRFTNRSTDVTDGISIIALAAGAAAAPFINNKSQACAGWEIMTSVEGLSAISVQLESSANTYTITGGSPTQWAAFQGTAVAGSNPSTSTTTSLYTGTGYFPWLRINVTSSLGTGSVDVILFGWKSTTLLTGGGGGVNGVITVFGRTGAVVGAVGDYSFSDIAGLIALTQLQPTVAVWTSGSGPPGGNCTTAQSLYLDTLNKDDWYCSGSNIWKKNLSTTNTGTWFLIGLNGADPCGTLLAGNDCISLDASDNLTVKNSAGTIKTLIGNPSPALLGVPTAPTAAQNNNSTQVATTAYTDLAVSNAVAAVNPAVAVLAASTANLVGTYNNGVAGIGATFTVTATGAFTLDGIAINTIGQRVLLKNQTSGFQNGMYTATVVGSVGVSPIFTRALDYDMPSDINSTGAIPVQSGTVNTTTSWLLTSNVNTVGTDALVFVQFSIAPVQVATSTAYDLVANGGAVADNVTDNSAAMAAAFAALPNGGTIYVPASASRYNFLTPWTILTPGIKLKCRGSGGNNDYNPGTRGACIFTSTASIDTKVTDPTLGPSMQTGGVGGSLVTTSTYTFKYAFRNGFGTTLPSPASTGFTGQNSYQMTSVSEAAIYAHGGFAFDMFCSVDSTNYYRVLAADIVSGGGANGGPPIVVGGQIGSPVIKTCPCGAGTGCSGITGTLAPTTNTTKAGGVIGEVGRGDLLVAAGPTIESISFQDVNTGHITTGPTWSSGGTACTNGTQTVTFTNGGGTGATGTITVSGGVPTGAVTAVNYGDNYTSVPTAGTVATCTGASVFTGGTRTVSGSLAAGLVIIAATSTYVTNLNFDGFNATGTQSTMCNGASSCEANYQYGGIGYVELGRNVNYTIVNNLTTSNSFLGVLSGSADTTWIGGNISTGNSGTPGTCYGISYPSGNMRIYGLHFTPFGVGCINNFIDYGMNRSSHVGLMANMKMESLNQNSGGGFLVSYAHGTDVTLQGSGTAGAPDATRPIVQFGTVAGANGGCNYNNGAGSTGPNGDCDENVYHIVKTQRNQSSDFFSDGTTNLLNPSYNQVQTSLGNYPDGCHRYELSVSGANFTISVDGNQPIADGAMPATLTCTANGTCPVLLTLPGRSRIKSISIKTITAWAGTATLTTTVGDSVINSGTAYTSTTYNMQTAVGNTNYMDAAPGFPVTYPGTTNTVPLLGMSASLAGSNVVANLVATTNNLSSITAGATDFYICTQGLQ